MQKFLLTASLGLIALTASAQHVGASPYSRYGLGTLLDRSASLNRGLAGTGIALSSGRMLNPHNAASYARIDSLSFLFDASVSLESAHYSASGASFQQQNARFDHLGLGFRLAPGLGISMGVSPFSTVGYDIKSEGKAIGGGISGKVKPTTNYLGRGGLQEVYLGMGYSPFRPLSIGASASYLWGNISNMTATSYDDKDVKTLTRNYKTEIRSYKFDLGLQYTQQLGRKNRLTLGLTYGLGRDLNGDALLIDQSGKGAATADTLTARSPYQLPESWGAGLAWEWNGRLTLAADFQHEAWSKATAPLLTMQQGKQQYMAKTGLYTDRQRYNLGLEYLPNPRGTSFASHVRYRAGLSYATPYAKIDGAAGPRVYTATLGVALPIVTAHNRRDNYSYLNISAQYDHVAPQISGQLTERYLRLTLGISFNQRWFQKWKVD